MPAISVEQPLLFAAEPDLPQGMIYRDGFISPAEESQLLAHIRALPFREAQYKEWNARRRIVSYGGRYDFDRNILLEAEPVPRFLHPLRERIAAWTGDSATQFSHVLLNEYRPGTPLGWHRDAPPFDTVVGVSLAGTARMRLRPHLPARGREKTRFLDIAPRSAYVLRGPARWHWQHAISPTKVLRYSITFRTLSARA
jgi:alkylated DNA repair dioxygenase AlkB